MMDNNYYIGSSNYNKPPKEGMFSYIIVAIL